MSTLNDQIKAAEAYQPAPQGGPVVVDHSGAANFALSWASRQAPRAEEPPAQMKPITPVAN